MTSNLTPKELAEAVAKIAALDAVAAANPDSPCDEIRLAHAAPLMAQVTRQLWAEREQREKQLRKALHPNGVKHPQQGEWAWLIEEVTAMQNRLDELEAHHCEAPRNKRIMELEKECAALAAHQCHKPYGDEYGNMRCEYQDKVARYESDHPWAKALQDVAEEQAATIARQLAEREQLQAEIAEQCRIIGMSGERELRHRAVMQQARDALAEALDRYTFDREDGTVGYAGPSDIIDVFPDTIAALDAVLKGE